MNQGVLAAAIVCGSIGFLVGIEHGRSLEAETSRKIFALADLTPACERQLRDGVDAYNAAGEGWVDPR